jgi:membrane-associated phospholipid phosphatase
MKFNFYHLLSNKSSLRTQFLIQVFVLFIIGLISLYTFLELAEEVSEKSLIVKIDNYLINFIDRSNHGYLKKILIWITQLASWKGILITSSLAFIFLLIKKHYLLSIEIALVTAGSITSNVILKNIFNRPRPEGDHAVEVISSSFPSGHAMVGCAVYGFFIYSLWMLLKNTSLKILCSSLILVLIVLIGFSRIYLGVHYPSDVMGGFAAGIFWLVLCLSIVRISKFFIYRKL